MLLLVLQTFPMLGGIKKAHAAMAGGGTSLNPYIIMTPQDLSDIRNNLSAAYKLGADIDLAGYDNGDHKGWLPIGDTSHFFTGTLEGNGYAIRNLTIDRTSTHLGLFVGILSPGKVNDIHLLDVNLKGFQYIGGIAGANSGTISNSYVTGSVYGSSAYIGGMAGFAAGSFQNSYAAVNVSGTSRVGGLVGDFANGGNILNSYATGSVTGTSNVGGLAGNVAGGFTATSIQNSYATGDVTGTSAVGGLAGKISGDSTYIASIQGSYSTGIVTGSGSDIGGLVGLATSPSDITDSFWNMETSGQLTSAAGAGKTTAQLKMQSTYSGLDFNTVWGIRDGETYPYLLAFKPILTVNPLTRVLYNLSSGQNEVSVTGTVYDASIGVHMNVDYVVKDSSNATVASVTHNTYSNGGAQAIVRTVPLTGLVSGSYTLMVSATQSYNAPVAAAPLAFTIDADPPSVSFGTNGSSWAQSASTTVTVNDTGSGADVSTLQYAWTQSTSTPAGGWTNFSSGDTLTQLSGDGNWYLHVRAADVAGNVTNIISNPFMIDNTAPTAAISSTAGGTVNTAFPITITFSEPVNSFNAGGIVVGNGTVSNLTSVSASAYTATVTPISSGQLVTVQVAVNVTTDAAGNGNTASTVVSFLYDTTKPTVVFGGFTANQVFSNPPSAVFVTVSEAVYWVAGGAPLTSANALALPLITMEKDNAAFSTYSFSYDELSRTYTLTFNGMLGDGVRSWQRVEKCK
ncbi:Ig-like domain-containing protein [Paenibacillus thalictri]|nr:Ig-like domain-containing protein [Paenibacillus thalictri]